MEENLEPEDELPEDETPEQEELEIDTNNPLFVFCFMFMEYVKGVNPDLYDKAHKYAQDHTDVDITDFEILEFDEDIEDDEDNEDLDEEDIFDNGYDDDDNE